MAKSIFETLADLKTETSVPVVGKNVEHTLPRKLFPMPEQFENSEMLLIWANENGYTHALLQAGIQKGLIDVRATFKACKKDDTWTAEYGQKNVDAMTWDITKRPNPAGTKAVDSARYNDCLKLIGNLCITKMPTDEIKEIAIPIYGAELVNNIFDFLNSLNKDK